MRVLSHIAIACLLSTGMGRAQSPAVPTLSVDMDNGSLNGLANSLSQQSKVRVLIAPGSTGRVTLHLHGVSLQTAVKTASAALDLKWRALWLSPQKAPRIGADEAAKIAASLDSVGPGPVAMDNGTRVIALRAAPDQPSAVEGLRPVYVFLPKVERAVGTPAPVQTVPQEQPQMAPSNDPEVTKLQRAFGTLSPEQQRTFVSGIRSYLRPNRGGGRNNRSGG